MESMSLSYWYDVLKQKLAGYPAFLPDIIMALPVGLLCGFLLKTLGRYLVIGLVVTAAFLWVADYFNIITIHHGQIEALLGMQPFSSLSEFFSFVSVMIKEHVAGAIALLIGFLLGWKLGW